MERMASSMSTTLRDALAELARLHNASSRGFGDGAWSRQWIDDEKTASGDMEIVVHGLRVARIESPSDRPPGTVADADLIVAMHNNLPLLLHTLPALLDVAEAVEVFFDPRRLIASPIDNLRSALDAYNIAWCGSRSRKEGR